ncbi:tRNA nucleotidyltransferas-like protein [Cucurbitaria berberidis CBS 394.84]|uniref:tRNA nucleotidyltransferas-like protein n=1 Tax=Cucurbitaria berberidis CBS 394.84 TaxID=1168544 RepID=A0A9P4GK07_9PLEO|nr:tRNA nucleotidyltransferas-like protein [Cucurbitaria berberidis CBS 394.84]KAF1846796.1 tRNA nucleotidyltransferas-like protein [Cucurbitaria berberidis CBS 394.84]
MSERANTDLVQLELTEVESNLRKLLLDVAAYIDNTPLEAEDTGVQVPDELVREKVALRWTGGWVRDKLLRVESHDIDLAINKMTGEHFGLKMQEYLEIPGNAEKHGLIGTSDKRNARDKTRMIAPGLHKIEANPEKSKNLETATTKIMGIDLDLVNLRKETYNEVSRNPQMEFGTAEEDAMRRDATVNAMFYNLHTCQVEDFTRRGHEDMAAKIIRTPLEPYQTFKDDPLRVLRLIRFASRLDYTVEPETAKAMGNLEIQDVLKIKISRERVGIELEKMLKGPRPRMALELIDRFGLYRTVFTDPSRELLAEPETAYFQPAYDFVESVVEKNGEIPETVPVTLLRTGDEQYLAWVCATVIPWADAPTVPHPKSAQRPLFPAYLVAREGFKAPNKVCDVVAASLTNSEEIRSLIAQCAKGLRRPETINPANDSTARDTLGMAIRRWGSTWRTQVFFNLVYEIVLGRVRKEELLRSYAAFLTHLTKLNILDVDTFRPLLKGTDLAKALNTKPGPWMKDALDIVMAWQLRNPNATDPSDAIEAVKVSRGQKTDSELPFCLASHFLQLTIPRFFPQNKPVPNALEASRQPAPWKDDGNQYALDLLKWSIGALDRKSIEAKWHFLVPPILKIIDDIDVEWKAKGCHLLGLLLESLRQAPSEDTSSQKPILTRGPSNFVQRTGYHNVFAETLLPLFTYIPSLTPEQDSVRLFHEVFPALTSLSLLLPTNTNQTDRREAYASDSDIRNRFLDKVLREGILSPLAHFPTPWTYPKLATTSLSHLTDILGHMGIESVKHLPDVMPLLSVILQEPFALGHQPLLLSTLRALQSVMANAWPRVAGYRGEMMMGLCLCWGRCVEEQKKGVKREVEEVMDQVRETFAMLDAVMHATEEDELRDGWEKEKRDVVQASPGHREWIEHNV